MLEEASTHKSAVTHANSVLCLVAFTFDPKINGFPGLMVEHFVKFGDPSCISFWDIVWKNWQTHKYSWKTLSMWLPLAW